MAATRGRGPLLLDDLVGLLDGFCQFLDEPLRQIVKLPDDDQLLFRQAIDVRSCTTEQVPEVGMLFASLGRCENFSLKTKLLEAELVLAVCMLLDEQLASLELVDEVGLLV